MQFFQGHHKIRTITTITHKYDMPKMVQETNLPDVSYCQKNWEENTEVVKDGLCLMGFGDDNNMYTRTPCHMWVQIITATWSIKQNSAEI